MENLKIEYVDIKSIKPYKNNAKKHPKEQIEQIKKSIEEFGMNDPIGIWKDEIVEGHGRLIACKELGMNEVPIIRLDHMTDEERRAYILAHNKLTMNSDFDESLLGVELDNILDIDMSDFGFEIVEELEEDEIVNGEVEAEVPFTEFVDEESQYVVLKFDNEKDWNYAQSVFKIEKVMNFSTRKDGKVNGVTGTGIGRVLNGIEAIKRIKDNSEELE